MGGTLISSLLAFGVSGVVMGLAWILHNRGVLDREKSSPFECGFDPMKGARVSFSLRFFLLAIIFLVFDIEIVLLFPILASFSFAFSSELVLGTLFFLVILILGLFHEWNEGSLNWMN
uniref:NADH-ubiquinone oxidoreductase chain 3 n=1 Tax=Obscurella hidalgoi TaxID=1663726 RepID=A0A0M3N1H0_OBSHI|nr:NADH dehydrogenase subunit 3 [Obscurella hidalgoi]AKL90688.1 NADH dehydrogenase subunit 3 [Obscurella hidalgoi]